MILLRCLALLPSFCFQVHFFSVIDQHSSFSANRNEKCKMLQKFLEKIVKIRDENLPILGQRSAKECSIPCTSIHFHYLIFNFCSFLPNDACKSDRSRQKLSNEYLIAKFGSDTAENEPSKVWQKVVIQSYTPYRSSQEYSGQT